MTFSDDSNASGGISISRSLFPIFPPFAPTSSHRIDCEQFSPVRKRICVRQRK